MGVQTFHPELLRRLGRRQETLDALPEAVSLLRQNGIRNLGFDLIYAIPGQNMEQWQQDLEAVSALSPQHVSAYALTLEEGTRLAEQFNVQAIDEDLSFEMWELAGDFLKQQGMPRYEISNYASEQWEAEHNQNIWHGQSYLGLGPAASSFDGLIRWTEVSSLTRWLQGQQAETDEIPRPQRIAEIFLMGLRTVRGWGRTEFFNCVPDAVTCEDLFLRLEKLKKLNLLTDDGDRIKLTGQGLAFWNDVAEMLL